MGRRGASLDRGGDREHRVWAIDRAGCQASAATTGGPGRPGESLDTAVREKSLDNLKRMMLGMHNYAVAKESALPPAFTAKNGKPLLSWRVAILPFVDQQALYDRFKLDEPWDSEHNKKLIAQIPDIYASPGSSLSGGRTVYLTPRGAKTAFPGDRGVKFKQITDGTSMTIAVVEVDDAHAVPWTKPDDWKFDPEHVKVGLHGQYQGSFLAAACDGSARRIPYTIDADQLKALFTISGGELVKWP
jgi:Protein of unknown function (DUF1559)